jgi:hypothetical protein
METLHTIWNFFLFFSLLIMPQLLGVLTYFRLRRYKDFLGHAVGFLVPPFLYFFFSWLMFLYVPREALAKDGCGMPALAAMFIILSGTIAQIFFSMITQLILHGRHRTQTI